MTAQAKTPLSLVVGLSTTLREPVLAAMTDATTVAVVIDQDELPERGVLAWRVQDASGPIDAGEFTVGDDCGACQLIESLVPLLETVVARAHWDHVVLATPPAMEARPLVTTLVASLPELAVDTVNCWQSEGSRSGRRTGATSRSSPHGRSSTPTSAYWRTPIAPPRPSDSTTSSCT
jgi:hypothetical protein